MCLKTGDLDLGLRGQICLETYKFCVIPCECDNFLIVMNFTFKLELCIDLLKVLHCFKNL